MNEVDDVNIKCKFYDVGFRATVPGTNCETVLVSVLVLPVVLSTGVLVVICMTYMV